MKSNKEDAVRLLFTLLDEAWESGSIEMTEEVYEAANELLESLAETPEADE